MLLLLLLLLHVHTLVSSKTGCVSCKAVTEVAVTDSSSIEGCCVGSLTIFLCCVGNEVWFDVLNMA